MQSPRECLWLVGLVLLIVVVGEQLSLGEELHHYARQREIMLQGGRIDTRQHAEFTEHEEFEAHKREVGAAPEHLHLFLVHFRTPYEATHEQEVRRDVGVSFVGYMPHNTWLMEGTEEDARSVQEHHRVKWVGAFMPADKLSPDLRSPATGDLSDLSWNAHSLRVVLTPAGADSAHELFPSWERDSQSSITQHGRSLTISFPDSSFDIFSMAKYFAKQEYVHWVQPEYLAKSHNRWAKGIVQGGQAGVGGETLAAAGLRGQGMIIGLGDTGLDPDSCFLSGSSAYPYDRLDLNHRKVVEYVTQYGDNTEFNPPHGTPVAAQMIGQTSGAGSEYNGLAPDAKLFFVDLNDGLTPAFTLPPNADSALFPLPSTEGVLAHVQVYPFGLDVSSYTELEQQVDSYAYSGNRKFLGVFSAGNNGRGAFGPGVSDAAAAQSPISGPGTSKNALSVGASHNGRDSFLQTEDFDSRLAQRAQGWRDLACGEDNTLFNRYGFCASVGLVSADEFPCSGFRGTFCGSFDGTPAQCCNWSYLNATCCPQTVRDSINLYPDAFDPDALSSFSSRGPAPDGRIKPDIVAPGRRIHSSNGNGCDISAYEGTSHSAGTVGAAATLIRQYFLEGRYPGPLEPINPSGALLKAMLVNSGQPLRLVNTNNEQGFEAYPGDIPDFRYGFGRVQLDKVIPLGSSPGFSLYVQDEVSFERFSNASSGILERFISTRYCLTIPDGAEYIKITMAWLDEPATLGAGVSLVNNLDMILMDREGYEYRANRLETLDNSNTVEQVYLRNPAPGEYSVYVHPTKLSSVDTDARFALVITGQFTVNENEDCLPDFTCPFACGFRGSCIDGRCICATPYAGPDCTLTPCGFGCGGNGYCHGEAGTCICDRFWTGADCTTPNPLGVGEDSVTTIVETDDDVAPGIVAGIAVGCFVIGFVVGALLLAWLTYRYLVNRQRQRIAQFQQQLKANRESEAPMLESSDDE